MRDRVAGVCRAARHRDLCVRRDDYSHSPGSAQPHSRQRFVERAENASSPDSRLPAVRPAHPPLAPPSDTEPACGGIPGEGMNRRGSARGGRARGWSTERVNATRPGHTPNSFLRPPPNPPVDFPAVLPLSRLRGRGPGGGGRRTPARCPREGCRPEGARPGGAPQFRGAAAGSRLRYARSYRALRSRSPTPAQPGARPNPPSKNQFSPRAKCRAAAPCRWCRCPGAPA